LQKITKEKEQTINMFQQKCYMLEESIKNNSKDFISQLNDLKVKLKKSQEKENQLNLALQEKNKEIFNLKNSSSAVNSSSKSNVNSSASSPPSSPSSDSSSPSFATLFKNYLWYFVFITGN
jgi:seryl-tRNA synthetase